MEVGKRTTRRPVGLSNNTWMTNWKHSLRSCLRDGRSYPNMPTTWIVVQDQMDKCQELERHLDWADEVRGSATIRMASNQQRDTAYYNRKAQPRAFKVGTLVFRKLQAN